MTIEYWFFNHLIRGNIKAKKECCVTMNKSIDKIEMKNFDMEKVIRVLIELLEEQEHVKIEYTLEKIR